ncbi:SET domain-containing protein [Pseudohyphozyma bogoriensis]|nr:SET domain-containing protein [Pseudohyphozyma bogoriensis]
MRNYYAVLSGNVDYVVAHDFDMPGFSRALAEHVAGGGAITTEVCTTTMVGALKNGWRVNFGDVKQEHLKRLGIRTGDIIFVDKAAECRLAEERTAILSDPKFEDLRINVVQKYVYRGKESGCRILIDNIILPAIDAAQLAHESSPVKIVLPANKAQRDVSTWRFALFTEHHIPAIASAVEGEEERLSFHGFLDYVVALIRPKDARALEKGLTIQVPEEIFVAVIEAKTQEELQKGVQQVMAQAVAMRERTGHTLFPAILTSGLQFNFYVAHAADAGVTVYSSESWRYPEDGGLIVGVIKEFRTDNESTPWDRPCSRAFKMPTTETTRAKNALKKKKSSSGQTKTHATKKGKTSVLNKYMNDKLAELKEKNPGKEHGEYMKEALAAWKPISGKGLGLVATSPIKAGSLVLSDAPLIVARKYTTEDAILAAYNQLSPSNQTLYKSLTNVHPEIPLLVGIF